MKIKKIVKENDEGLLLKKNQFQMQRKLVKKNNADNFMWYLNSRARMGELRTLKSIKLIYLALRNQFKRNFLWRGKLIFFVSLRFSQSLCQLSLLEFHEGRIAEIRRETSLLNYSTFTHPRNSIYFLVSHL